MEGNIDNRDVSPIALGAWSMPADHELPSHTHHYPQIHFLETPSVLALVFLFEVGAR